MKKELAIKDRNFSVIEGEGRSTSIEKPNLAVVNSDHPQKVGSIHNLVSRGRYHRSPTEIAKRVIAAHTVRINCDDKIGP